MMRTTATLVLLTLLAAAGCNDRTAAAANSNETQSPPTGKSCTIYFRHDVLGSANTPSGPMVDSAKGVQLSISGKMLHSDADWVVLDKGNETLWVPRQSVLLLSFPN